MKTKYLLIFSVLLFMTNLSYAWFDPLPETQATSQAAPTSVSVSQPVTLSSTDSYVPEGSTIAKCEWDFTNDDIYDYNETSTDCADGAFDGVTTHSYDTDGTYTVKLRITTTDNQTSTDICAVEVSNGSGNLLGKKAIEVAGGSNNGQPNLLINRTACGTKLCLLGYEISRFLDTDPVGWIL
jgi:hypothetical protein